MKISILEKSRAPSENVFRKGLVGNEGVETDRSRSIHLPVVEVVLRTTLADGLELFDRGFVERENMLLDEFDQFLPFVRNRLVRTSYNCTPTGHVVGRTKCPRTILCAGFVVLGFGEPDIHWNIGLIRFAEGNLTFFLDHNSVLLSYGNVLLSSH